MEQPPPARTPIECRVGYTFHSHGHGCSIIPPARPVIAIGRLGLVCGCISVSKQAPVSDMQSCGRTLSFATVLVGSWKLTRSSSGETSGLQVDECRGAQIISLIPSDGAARTLQPKHGKVSDQYLGTKARVVVDTRRRRKKRSLLQ
jgi:hypothetical protein